MNTVLSETLSDDTDAELEKELAELINEDYTDVSATTAESNSEVEKLEQRLNSLRMDGKYYGIYYILQK